MNMIEIPLTNATIDGDRRTIALPARDVLHVVLSEMEKRTGRLTPVTFDGRTPGEIARMVENCENCPTCDICPEDSIDVYCDQSVVIHYASKLIRKLEDDLAAAIADLKKADVECDFCAHNGKIDKERCKEADCECMVCRSKTCPCKTCIDMSGWAWRGESKEKDDEKETGKTV